MEASQANPRFLTNKIKHIAIVIKFSFENYYLKLKTHVRQKRMC